jgi:hypothetical protein
MLKIRLGLLSRDKPLGVDLEWENYRKVLVVIDEVGRP